MLAARHESRPVRRGALVASDRRAQNFLVDRRLRCGQKPPPVFERNYESDLLPAAAQQRPGQQPDGAEQSRASPMDYFCQLLKRPSWKYRYTGRR